MKVSRLFIWILCLFLHHGYALNIKNTKQLHEDDSTSKYFGSINVINVEEKKLEQKHEQYIYFLVTEETVRKLVQNFIHLLVVPIISSNVQGTNVTTFYNVIAQDGADPWVFKHTDGWYYMTRTTGDVRIWRSRTFTSIEAGDSVLAWSSSGSGAACRSAWAPELHLFDSHW